MWDLISSFISLIIGATSPILPNGLPYTTDYVNQGTISACYQPDPSNTITLDKNNFINVSNPRPTLNPAIWKNDSVGPSFNSYASCSNYVLGNSLPATNRTFILVRKDVRISSCKVDELAGPYAKGTCSGWNNNAAAMTHRGSCNINDYPDLRKIADVAQQNGKPLEIFWNPFSHNVGCNYDTGLGINCGPGGRHDLDLKDFIYVLKKRDAFDPVTHKGCLALWDAGSTNENACSHYFDVYLASDVYQQMQSVDASQTTPDTEMYFLKNIVENCHENTTFLPAPQGNLDIPPQYISSPFVTKDNTSGSNENKIIPGMVAEANMYQAYIWNKISTFFDDSGKSLNLVQQGQSTDPITTCVR